ncbi:hypothetical protein [Botrimarina mediterranea]|uniref:Uncharacterized protein n=1 Tax=Botrimarina mediterranea TaxID=2528022 RepID=A0A518KAM7_9BACT|nr:hypothetical protein [Botrimarina mediterranea]QDV74840.1 hypothetical protein Spa11_30490 [Botrimarina mediterranea]QDV79483.1 hypothetical protein K2D_30980 [Planctomycetes bacterium K2D]
MPNSLLAPEPTTTPAPVPVEGGFVDRRREKQDGVVRERRQFTNSHDGLSDEAGELARAIDSYKARHRRRFINYEEMLSVVKSLGYSR